MRRPSLPSALLLCLWTSASSFAQSSDKASAAPPTGRFEAAFNHEVPSNWKKGQPGWDGEPDSPYRYRDQPARFMASHLSLIPRGPFQGQVLAWNRMRVMVGEQYWAIVDPVNKKFNNYSVPSGPDDEDWFCSGHAWTKDGDLLVAGGNMNINGWISASQRVYRFVPTRPPGAEMWVREKDLAIPRWYPTVTSMGTDSKGRDLVLVIGGTRDSKGRKPFRSYEAFDPSGKPGNGSWQLDPSHPESRIFPGPRGLKRVTQLNFYPRVHLLSDGSLFFSGMGAWAFRLQHADISAKRPAHWDLQAKNPERTFFYNSSVLLPNLGGPKGDHMDLVMRTAGADVKTINNIPQAPPFLPGPPWNKPNAITQWIHATLPAEDPAWTWNESQPLSFRRARADTTLLPNGTVLASGGKLDTQVEVNCGVPVLNTEIFDVASKTWRTDASAKVRRGYHSAAALLPDGRVLMSGGEAREMDYEIYRPPYLTDGSKRPRILQQAPPGEAWEWGYGQAISVPFEIEDDVQVRYGVLMAPASTTHHSDMHQRYVELELLPAVTPSESGQGKRLRLRTPPNSNHAPKGYYMLFLVTEVQGQARTGTPSEAAWIKLQ